MLASQLYALSQGALCLGSEICHWCGGPCNRNFIHDDPPRIMFVRNKSTAKQFSSPFVCIGCWLWRRTSLTVPFLKGDYKDRQAPKNHSWYIRKDGAWGIDLTNPIDRELLRTKLLEETPTTFALLLRDDKDIDIGIHLAHVSIPTEKKAHFTHNNARMPLDLKELDSALRTSDNAGNPGTRYLLSVLPRYKEEERPSPKRGRPRK